jgi:hypothetical protein
MSSTIVKPSTLDKSLVNFGEPQANSHGGKSLKVGYSQEGKFLIQAPTMYIPWDLSKEEMKMDSTNKDPKASAVNGVKYSMQLSFRGIESEDANGKRIKSFHNMINDLDNLLVETASSNSLTWLKMKSAPKPVVEALLNPTIKVSKDVVTQEPDGKYPDSIKVRIPYYAKDDKLGCAFFDKDGKHLTDMSVLNKLRRGTQVSCILECSGVYFSNGKFGMTWSLYQCAIKSENSNRIPKGICLITDSDDENEEYTHSTPNQNQKATGNQVSFTSSILVQDENDEDDLDSSGTHHNTTQIDVKPVIQNDTVAPKKVVRKTTSAAKK